jgi:anti-sigma-K factor RskA
VIARDDLHSLAAAYVLDALDDNERREFEQHLEDCPACAEELDSLRDAASALAFAVEGPAPPPSLRESILERARAERPPEVASIRSRRRYALPVVTAVAAVAACAAIALGVWASTLNSDLDSEQRTIDQIGSVLSDGGARTIALTPQRGQLVVAPSGNAVLVASGIQPAPSGKTYEAWVVPAKGAPVPAGIFRGGNDAVLLLNRDVPRGTKVAVSLEPAGGSQKLSGPVLFATQETV